MKLPELGDRVRLQRKRTRSGYTMVRVTKATRALLAKIEQEFSEPLDSIIFYMAAKELGHDYAALICILDRCINERRLGCAPAAR